MKRAFIIDDIIIAVGNGDFSGGAEITEERYSEIIKALSFTPTAPDGYGYRLKADLTWELYELPVAEKELTAEEALAIILGGEA